MLLTVTAWVGSRRSSYSGVTQKSYTEKRRAVSAVVHKPFDKVGGPDYGLAD